MPPFTLPLLATAAAAVTLIVDPGAKQYQGKVLDEVPIGEVAGQRVMKMTELVMAPGAAIPPHQHAGPGMRYVMEGAIAITWADGRTETYSKGSSYYEGPGGNHPPGQMSARNPTDQTTRVLIVEVLPQQQASAPK